MDMLISVQNIQIFIQGMSFEQFVTDLKTIRAVAFEVGIIGEAARAIPAEIQAIHPEIPWEKLQTMRNFIIHEYFKLDEEILWQTVTQDLPPLVAMLKALL